MNPVRSLPARLTVAIGLAAGVALAAPAGAQAECYQVVTDGPSFCKQQVWFVPGQSKAGNAAAASAAATPTWVPEAPKQSVAAGAGGGYATAGALRQTQGGADRGTGALFTGTFTGDIDNLAVTMYLFSPARTQEQGWYGGIDLVVDGVTLTTTDVDGVPLSSGGNAVQKIDFAVGKVHQAMTRAKLATGPDVVHDVQLFVTSYTLATTTAVLVYGTTEAPSSMTFNVGDLAGRFVV